MRRRTPLDRFFVDTLKAPEQRADLAAFLLDRRRSDDGLQRSNRGGWQSSPDLHLAPQVAPLATEVVQRVKKLCGVGELHSTWGNINDRGDWVKPHRHAPFVAVIVMVQPVPLIMGEAYRDDGALLVQDHLARFQPFHLKAGEAMVLADYQLHMVAPHRQSQPRVTVAFNLKRPDG